MHKFSKKLIKLIKDLEGYSEFPYQDNNGVWTIGYGHTAAYGYPDPKTKERIDEKEAEEILINDLNGIADSVDKLIKVKLPQSKLETIYSFVFNTGIERFRKSTMLKYINNGEFDKFEVELKRWCYVDRKLNTLLNGKTRKDLIFWNSVKNLVLSKRNMTLFATFLTTASAKIVTYFDNSVIAQNVFLFGLFALLFGGIGIILYHLYKIGAKND